MSEEKQYRVVQGAIKVPRNVMAEAGEGVNPLRSFILQGELLPPGIGTARDIRSWLLEGRIEEASVTPEQVEEAVERLTSANPFCVDPSTLVGKAMEDLLLMVFDIDPEYDTETIEDEKAAVRLLTSGWDPKYAQTISPVNDRSRPEALALHRLEQSEESGRATNMETSEMSEAARQSLEAAKGRAQAPQDPTE